MSLGMPGISKVETTFRVRGSIRETVRSWVVRNHTPPSPTATLLGAVVVVDERRHVAFAVDRGDPALDRHGLRGSAGLSARTRPRRGGEDGPPAARIARRRGASRRTSDRDGRRRGDRPSAARAAAISSAQVA